MSKYQKAIEKHYQSVWGETFSAFRWNRGPSHELPREFAVLRFLRKPGMLAYATRCMSQEHDEDPLELHMLVRETDRQLADEQIVELLTVVAHFHRTEHALGLGHTVNFGRPWLPSSRCSHGLVSLPYLDGPSLEWLEQPRIRFLWLIAITDAERELKRARGVGALEELFEVVGFDYLDPQRPSVC